MNISYACLIAVLAVPADPGDAPLPLPPLSFESRSLPQTKAEAAKLVPPGVIAFDDRYRVPNSQAPNADFSYEQAAIRSVVQNLNLKHWSLLTYNRKPFYAAKMQLPQCQQPIQAY